MNVDSSALPELTLHVAVPLPLDGGLTKDDFVLTSTASTTAVAVERLPADTLEVVVILDDTEGVSPGAFVVQQAALVEMLRQLEPGTSVAIATATGLVASPPTTDIASALVALSFLTARHAPAVADPLASVPAARTRRAVVMVDALPGAGFDPRAVVPPGAATDGTFLIEVGGPSSSNVPSPYPMTVLPTPGGQLVSAFDDVAAALRGLYQISFLIPEATEPPPTLMLTVDQAVANVSVPPPPSAVPPVAVTPPSAVEPEISGQSEVVSAATTAGATASPATAAPTTTMLAPPVGDEVALPPPAAAARELAPNGATGAASSPIWPAVVTGAGLVVILVMGARAVRSRV